MNQQVNLLAPMFRKQQALFSSRITLATCGVVAVALLLVYGIAAWRGAALAGEHDRLLAQRDTITRRLNELAGQFAGKTGSRELAAEVAALTQERDRKVQALAALARRELGNTSGFSPHFLGLARQRLDGLWLTRIQVSASGTQMALQGVTLSEELIPQYLRKLGAEAIFAGTQFEHAQLERLREGGNQLQFELRTQAAGARP